ncbi:ATPase of the AAA+ class [Hoeflea phototrophica DFL-43]|uniref:ATPase of the AAA+ class n=2 Tax=Hoeflea TaxID=274591 RepID=A9CZZ3_HOEPD|nr:ATPase of the AAA+ class [Hoeflea phototrophica DFL-43]
MMSKSKITDRIFHYLIARQRRAARIEVFERAADAGILERVPLGENDDSAMVWQLSSDHAAQFSGDPDHDREVIRAALEASGRKSNTAGLADQADEFGEFGDAYDFDLPDDECGTVAAAVKHSHAQTDGTDPLHQADLDEATAATANETAHIEPNMAKLAAALRGHVLSVVGGFAPGLKPEQVATALLLARAVGDDERMLERLTSAIARKWPIVAVQVPVHDFVRQFGLMLEEGIVLPFYTSLSSIRSGPTLSGRHKPLADLRRRKSIGTVSGAYLRRTDEEDIRQVVSRHILALEKPVIIADEVDEPLPSRLTAVADITIRGRGIDASLIAEVLALCCGVSASQSLFLMNEVGFEPDHLGIDDLAVAIRPGRSLNRMLSVLMTLEDENISNAEDKDGDGKSSDGKGSLGPASKSALASKRKKFAGCFDVIEPAVARAAVSETASGSAKNAAAASARGNGKDHLLVENLSGYGEAKGWALDLSRDLYAWEQNQVDWSDLSSRLLLSGPPGTGKTTFAKALCNTLQVPLVATSVARWLETSHLGDVLAAMTTTFEHATQLAPCILFIDEIDNIGNRGGGSERHYDDYWSTLVNRMLELLDGASKTEGVIVVGATNNPEKIDAALLRSGRLEKHIMIPPPDTEALIGIIAHHLGSDLDTVLRSHAGNGMAELTEADAPKAGLPDSVANDDVSTPTTKHHKGVPAHG